MFRRNYNDQRRMPVTAREIAERRKEKLLMLGPVLERLRDEMLTPLIESTFGLALSAAFAVGAALGLAKAHPVVAAPALHDISGGKGKRKSRRSSLSGSGHGTRLFWSPAGNGEGRWVILPVNRSRYMPHQGMQERLRRMLGGWAWCKRKGEFYDPAGGPHTKARMIEHVERTRSTAMFRHADEAQLAAAAAVAV